MVAKKSGRSVIKDIKRNTRKIYNAEEKISIVIEGLRGEQSIAELCREYGINQANYYKWSKDFMEAGKKRLNGDTQRNANSEEVTDLRKENDELKLAVADLFLKNEYLKKSIKGLE